VWEIESTDEFDEWFYALNEVAQIEIAAKIELLRQYGPALSRPHADTLKGSKFANMKELRGKTASAVLRIAFAFDPKRHAILLAGGNKAGVNEKRFYRQLIRVADPLFKKHLSRGE
jgi:hypothetical protein